MKRFAQNQTFNIKEEHFPRKLTQLFLQGWKLEKIYKVAPISWCEDVFLEAMWNYLTSNREIDKNRILDIVIREAWNDSNTPDFIGCMARMRSRIEHHFSDNVIDYINDSLVYALEADSAKTLSMIREFGWEIRVPSVIEQRLNSNPPIRISLD